MKTVIAGRTIDGWERRRAQDRLRKRVKYQSDENHRKQKNAQREVNRKKALESEKIKRWKWGFRRSSDRMLKNAKLRHGEELAATICRINEVQTLITNITKGKPWKIRR